MSDGTPDAETTAVPEGRARWVRRTVLGTICALVIGVYAWSAHSGIVELFGSKADDSYYNLLVQGFRAGQLNLKTEVPSGLAQLADPYDPNANSSYCLQVGHPLWDTSYYKGKLYLYFGVTPVLVLFWPYAALTGHYLWHKDAVVIFFSAGFLASAGLLWAVWRRYFAEVSVWAVMAGTLALGLADFVPAILQRLDMYEVAISCGYALTVLALAGIWCAMHDSRRQRLWLAAASLAFGLAAGARPSLLPGALILLVPLIRASRQKQRVWPLLLGAIGPITLIGIGLMLYNGFRFDDPLEFGQSYQLMPVRHNAMPQFSLRYLWFNSWVGFLALARWSGRFPFVQDIALPTLPRGAGVEHPFGVLTNIPLVWLALAAPLAWHNRSAGASSPLRWFLAVVALLFGTCALTLVLHNSMCLRYEVEFTNTLVLLAAIGILGLERALAGRRVWRIAVGCGWGLLLTFSVAFNLLAGLARHAETELNLGNALLQKGQVDDAIAHYRRALELQPESATLNHNLGYLLLQKGQVDEALVRFQKAVEIEPDNAAAHNDLGYAFLRKGLMDWAIVHFQRALEIQPDDGAAHNNLGSACLQMGRLDEAIAHYQRAVQLDPHNPTAHDNLGSALRQKGRVDEAIGEFQEALRLKPDLAGASNNLATALGMKEASAKRPAASTKP